ncbi:MAG: tetratricopeptide repeat protein [Myxococcota bacterium]
MAEPRSPFEILGVPPDVDDATLKRAYFTKVREHPPERDPAGFQEVRAAFEALRDPHHRQALAEQLGSAALPEALEALLAQAEKAEAARDLHTAIDRLREAVEEFPDAPLARAELARKLAAVQRTPEAIAVASQLARLRPDDVAAHVLLAQLHMSTYEYEPARAALAAARACGPTDRRPLFVEALMNAQMERWDEALATLDRALALPGERFVSNGEIIGRRVMIQLQRGVPEALEAEVERVTTSAASPEEKERAASILSFLSAFALREGKPALA